MAILATCAVSSVAGAAETPPADASASLIPKRGEWVNISKPLLAEFAKQDVKPKIKFDYDNTPGAGLCGIIVDRSLKETWFIVQGTGVWKRAAGGAAPAFVRVDGGKYDAFWENAGPDIDPEGRGLCVFSIQGQNIDSSCAITRDGGKTWTALTTDKGAFGYDVGAVDWAGGGMAILAKKHHTSGDLVLSHDGGQTWTKLEGDPKASITTVGLIGAGVLIKGVGGASGGLFRSTDDGKTWAKVGDIQGARIGHVVTFKGVAYLTTNRGISISKDKGETWSILGRECQGLRGPVMFGEDEKHIVVYGTRGFSETKDAGQTWTLAVPFGDDAAMRKARFECGFWDPATDCFYLTHLAGEAYGYRR
jgi:hypothetical protein